MVTLDNNNNNNNNNSEVLLGAKIHRPDAPAGNYKQVIINQLFIVLNPVKYNV